MWRKGSFNIQCQEFHDVSPFKPRDVYFFIKVSLEFSSIKWTKSPFFVPKIILGSELSVTVFPGDYCPNLSLH